MLKLQQGKKGTDAPSGFGLRNIIWFTGILTVAVLPAPALAQTNCVIASLAGVTEVSGREVVLPLSFVGHGTENALSFSLSFDPALLTYQGDMTGAGAAGAVLNRNTNQIVAGRIGYGFARPPGQRFASGTNDLLRVRFQLGSTVATTAVTFADSPAIRETVDGAAQVLCTSYNDGVINITPLLPASIVTPPQSLTLQPITNIATNVSFSVAASGSPPLFYQWLFQGNLMTNATNATLALVNVQPSQAGEYRVAVTNDGRAVTSPPAMLVLLPPFIPPRITLAPSSQVVSTGETVVLTADATGNPTPSFQWLFKGSILSGATNTVLVLTNINTGQAGNYALFVSNAAGSLSSAAAMITVTPSLRIVRAIGSSAATGGNVDMPVELIGFGDENSVGFSISSTPEKLLYRGVSLGSGASGSTLLVNTNQLSAGIVGIGLTKPAGQSFPAGTRQLLMLHFQAGDFSGSNSVVFADIPVTREIADALGNPRPSSFRDGGVDILATPPMLTSEPQGGTIPIFSNITFHVTAVGSVPISFQWQFNEKDLLGGTSSSLTLR